MTGKAKTVLFLLGCLGIMTGLSAASVPLYRLFCQATGLNGTTQRGKSTALMTLMTAAALMYRPERITFFGIGPVLFADGSDQERLITLMVVLLIYALWFVLLMLWRRKSKTLKV